MGCAGEMGRAGAVGRTRQVGCTRQLECTRRLELQDPAVGSQMDPEGLGVSFIRDIARDKTCPKDSEVLSLLSCSLGRQEKHIF